MKCPNCHFLNCADDTQCHGCRASLAPARQAVARQKAIAETPQWAYIFAAICGAIPIVTLGGAVPAVIGFGGAGTCLQVARTKSLPSTFRFVACVMIAIACWVGLAAFMVSLYPDLKRRFNMHFGR